MIAVECMNCGHPCHCGDKCADLPMQGGCGCVGCAHPREEETMIKKIWKKIKGWLGLV